MTSARIVQLACKANDKQVANSQICEREAQWRPLHVTHPHGRISTLMRLHSTTHTPLDHHFRGIHTCRRCRRRARAASSCSTSAASCAALSTSLRCALSAALAACDSACALRRASRALSCFVLAFVATSAPPPGRVSSAAWLLAGSSCQRPAESSRSSAVASGSCAGGACRAALFKSWVLIFAEQSSARLCHSSRRLWPW